MENNNTTEQSELFDVVEAMKKDDDLGSAIDKVFESTDNIHEIQAKIILLIQESLKIKCKKDISVEKDLIQDIGELSRHFLDTHIQPDEIDHALEPVEGIVVSKGRRKRKDLLDNLSKKNLKRLLKNFAVYEVYKVMNPKRIAGETKKENYTYNMMVGGEKLASKYEGGKDSDLKQYGESEVSRIKNQANSFKKGGGGIGY
ncbi:MAG: DUF5394 family protein [Rickettsiaceae bacterium]